MAYGNDLSSLVDGLVSYMVDGSPFATLAGEEMSPSMKQEMEDSMERLATPIHSHILSWWSGIGNGTFPDELVKSDIADPTPGYLSTKVDDNTLKVNIETHRIYVDSVPLATPLKTGGVRIGAQPYLYLNNSNLMLNIDTSSDLSGGTNKVPSSQSVKLYVDSVVSGGSSGGTGDMLKSTYDTNTNGIVDNSEKLGNQSPSYYLDWDNFSNTPTSISSYGIADAYTKINIDAFFEGESGGKKQVLWSNILTTPTSLTGYGIADAYTKINIDDFFEGESGGKKTVNWDNITNQPTLITLTDTGVASGELVVVSGANTLDSSNYMSFSLSDGLFINHYLEVYNRVYFQNHLRMGSSRKIYFGSDVGGWDTYLGEESDDVFTLVVNSVEALSVNGGTNQLFLPNILGTGTGTSMIYYNRTSGEISYGDAPSGLADCYSSITDGTNTANSSGSDTFKIRSANNLLTVLVTNDDVTHGDNLLLTINETNINHDNLSNYVSNEHIDWTNATNNILTSGSISSSTYIYTDYLREYTTDNGVIVDTALIKDNKIYPNENWNSYISSDASNNLLLVDDIAGSYSLTEIVAPLQGSSGQIPVADGTSLSFSSDLTFDGYTLNVHNSGLTGYATLQAGQIASVDVGGIYMAVTGVQSNLVATGGHVVWDIYDSSLGYIMRAYGPGDGGGTIFYYGTSAKLTITTNGITVAGSVAATSMTIDSNTVWHAGNDGTGSGLDADLWDGNEFSTYLNQTLLTTSNPAFNNLSTNSISTDSNESIAFDIVEHTLDSTDVSSEYFNVAWSKATSANVISILPLFYDTSASIGYGVFDDTVSPFYAQNSRYDGTNIRIDGISSFWAVGDIVKVLVVYKNS